MIFKIYEILGGIRAIYICGWANISKQSKKNNSQSFQ